MKRALVILLVVAALAGGAVVWRKPGLVIYLDPALRDQLDLTSLRRVFWRAGVWKLSLRPYQGDSTLLGERTIAIELGQGRNPLLTPETIERGFTGPGHTEERVARVYPEDIDLFMVKHHRKFMQAGYNDWERMRRRLMTNTAVHEAWHAITLSHSHNVTDLDSVMYKDPGKGALSYATRELNFTRGHLERLHEIFSL